MGIFKSKEEKAAIKEKKEIKAESKMYYTGLSLQQIGKIQQGWAVNLTLDPYEEKMHIVNQKSGIDITIPYERLKGFRYENETTLAQSGGTIGRAVVGGLLFGGAGAVVGGMSGKGRTKTKWYGTLSFVSKDGENQELLFADLMGENNLAHKTFESKINEIAVRNSEDITEL